MNRAYGEAQYARLRYETWMRSHRLMTKAVIAMAVATALAVTAAFWALISKPEPRYFAARENGGILPLVPVSVPFLSDGEVTNFAVEAVTRALTMDFANWRSDLSGAAHYFERPVGWNSFLDALEGSGMLSYIRENRLVSTAVANGAVVVSSGPDGSKRYGWTVQIPLTITYESASELSRDSLIAEASISRLPTWEAPEAVGITRIIVRPGRGTSPS
ncbi:MAG: type IVB secretion system apparatus protein IcmL/DotI [Rhodobacteraceae bacterium]|nr:type IVB secretion system apparatus protein IcmL/DotI [Paracoccaceae bacterium]